MELMLVICWYCSREYDANTSTCPACSKANYTPNTTLAVWQMTEPPAQSHPSKPTL